jgi:hypothetical protein
MHDKATGPHKTQFRRDEDYGKLIVTPPKFKSHYLEALATKYFRTIENCDSFLVNLDAQLF